MSGKITEFLVEEDSTVQVGQDLLKMEPGEEEALGDDAPPKTKPEGGARSEPKDLEEGNKSQAAPAAGKEKGATEDTHQKQEEKAPGMKSSEEEKPAPRKEEQASTPSPKKEDKPPASKPAPKEKEEKPIMDKSVGSRNETRVRRASMSRCLGRSRASGFAEGRLNLG